MHAQCTGERDTCPVYREIDTCPAYGERDTCPAYGEIDTKTQRSTTLLFVFVDGASSHRGLPTNAGGLVVLLA